MRLQIDYEHEIPVNAFIWIPESIKKPLHYHTSLEIGCCISGEGEFYFGSKKYSVVQGDIFIVNHMEMHIARSAEHNPSTFLFINFDPNLLLVEDERLLLPFSIPSERFQNLIPAVNELSKKMFSIMKSIWSELESKQEGYQIMVKGLLLQLCSHILRHYCSQTDPEAWKKLAVAFSKFRLLSDYMNSNFNEPLDLNQLANVLKISPSRVSRLFQEVLGRSFKEYLLLLLLTEARRLLIRADLSITEVCFASGFQSVSSFYRLFAAAEGVSPMNYRSKYSGVAIFENEEL